MKVTIVQGAFFPVPTIMGGAVEKVWHTLGTEFSRRGHVVTHISRRHQSLANREMANGVRQIRISGFDAPESSVRHKCLDLLYSLRTLSYIPFADIIVTNTFWFPLLVRDDRNGKLYVHVARHPKGHMFLYGRAARLQTVAHSVAEAITREAPHLRAKVKVIPYPVGSGVSAKIVATTTPRCVKTILYVGRIHPEKGIEILIRAFGMLSQPRALKWRLAIVGSADSRFGGGGASYLRRLHEVAMGVADRTDWLGPVFDPKSLSELYRSASLFVYPSLAERGETFGLAPLEAMSNGCPTIVSNLGCFRDYLQDGTNGYVFNHRRHDPAKALCEKIEECIKDEVCLKQTGYCGLSTAKGYSIQRVADAYLNDFASLIKEPCKEEGR